MAGFELDSDLKKRLKIGKGQLDKIGSSIKTGLDKLHASGVKTGPATANAGGIKPPTEKTSVQGRRIVKPKSLGADTLKSAHRKPISTSVAAPATTPIDQPRKPSFNAADTIPKAGAAGADSPLKGRAKKSADKNLYGQAELVKGDMPDTHGSMYVKDPMTGEKTPREGYRNEAGTFIPGPRIKPHELGSLMKHAAAGVKDPEMRKAIFQSIGKQGGVLDPESGRTGSELARRGDQKLEGIKGRYLESAAKIRANADVESAGLAADAYATRGVGGAGYSPKGYQSVTDEEGNLSVFNKDTGEYSAPGTEMSPEAKAAIDKIRSNPEKMKQFYLDNPTLRPSIRQYLSSTDSFR